MTDRGGAPPAGALFRAQCRAQFPHIAPPRGVVMVTHDPVLADLADDRVIGLD